MRQLMRLRPEDAGMAVGCLRGDCTEQGRDLTFRNKADLSLSIIIRKQCDVQIAHKRTRSNQLALDSPSLPGVLLRSSRSGSIPRLLPLVTQDDTLMRMAVFPCQTVGPHQHVPSVCRRAITRDVFSAVAKRDQNLVEHDIIQNLEAGGAQPQRQIAARGSRFVRQSPAIPAFPNCRSPAHSSMPRARRESSGT